MLNLFQNHGGMFYAPWYAWHSLFLNCLFLDCCVIVLVGHTVLVSLDTIIVKKTFPYFEQQNRPELSQGSGILFLEYRHLLPVSIRQPPSSHVEALSFPFWESKVLLPSLSFLLAWTLDRSNFLGLLIDELCEYFYWRFLLHDLPQPLSKRSVHNSCHIFSLLEGNFNLCFGRLHWRT